MDHYFPSSEVDVSLSRHRHPKKAAWKGECVSIGGGNCANLSVLLIMLSRWILGITAGLFLGIFCLYPQMKMVYLRGAEWNGHYAYNDIDEVAYASYVRALIDGRPRKNDPYTGRDQSPETPQPESLFSIQFAAPYTIAMPARILGVGAPWAMTLAGAFAGFAAAFAVFWLMRRLTDDDWFAFAAALGVFCFGTLAAGEGAISEILFNGFSYPYFPGFRRYIPAMAFPAFFVMVGSVRLMLRDDERFSPKVYGAVSLACFAYVVFSYFYVWTTAAAFLAVMVALTVILRNDGWKRDVKRLAILGVGCLIVLIPYAYLLSGRSETMDSVQLLVKTHAPDIYRFPEYVSVAVVIFLIIAAAFKAIDLRERTSIFTLALAVVPFVLFNQQVVTGMSLQPIHYQVFIGNYVAALAAFAAVGVVWRGRIGEARNFSRIACGIIAGAAIIWGFVECHYTVRVLDEANVVRDEFLPVGKRLEELAKNTPDPHRTTVFLFNSIEADDLPTIAPQNVIWSRHQHVFAGLSWQESKERYYQYLFFHGVDDEGLKRLIRRDFVTMIALFGWGRHSSRLSSEATPITLREIDDEAAAYLRYVDGFNVAKASETPISYVVVRTESQDDLSILERFYELFDAETVGNYTLYRARLREEEK